MWLTVLKKYSHCPVTAFGELLQAFENSIILSAGNLCARTVRSSKHFSLPHRVSLEYLRTASSTRGFDFSKLYSPSFTCYTVHFMNPNYVTEPILLVSLIDSWVGNHDVEIYRSHPVPVSAHDGNTSEHLHNIALDFSSLWLRLRGISHEHTPWQ